MQAGIGEVGGHLIDGCWECGAGEVFASEPATGAPRRFASATAAEVEAAARAAEDAFGAYSVTTAQQRARFLDRIAAEMQAREGDIIAIASAETGLPETRIKSELARTTGQLRLFSQHILQRGWLDIRHDPALPSRTPPRPDLRLIQRPVGPVAVFSASNFPLAFSVAGGDTASALAAGCPVIVKAHQAHPATSEIVAQAIDAARRAEGLPAGVFAMLQSATRATGTALVTHPLITAVGFTGSTAGGRALFDLCAARPVPIPFYGELGSVNPLFVLRGAGLRRGRDIARGWVASLTQGAGQFCTKPGLAILPAGEIAERFLSDAAEALAQVPLQCMLSETIAQGFRTSIDRLRQKADVQAVHGTNTVDGRDMGPILLRVKAQDFLEDADMSEEAFGPGGLAITVANPDEAAALARSLPGQLTATIHGDPEDHPEARNLMPILERKAGRLVWNGFPTGVEVADAMVHGGPYPASTNFGATSVGTLSIRRWLRPVCYQDMPVEMLATVPR
jgi:NADP-dependent aldehyde dehydrogenase